MVRDTVPEMGTENGKGVEDTVRHGKLFANEGLAEVLPESILSTCLTLRRTRS